MLQLFYQYESELQFLATFLWDSFELFKILIFSNFKQVPFIPATSCCLGRESHDKDLEFFHSLIKCFLVTLRTEQTLFDVISKHSTLTYHEFDWWRHSNIQALNYILYTTSNKINYQQVKINISFDVEIHILIDNSFSLLKHNSYIRGYQAYMDIWTPIIRNGTLFWKPENNIDYEDIAVATLYYNRSEPCIVAHVPFCYSSTFKKVSFASRSHHKSMC